VWDLTAAGTCRASGTNYIQYGITSGHSMLSYTLNAVPVWRLTQYSQFSLVIHNQSLVHSVLQLRNNKQWSSYLALSSGTPNR
jgi:hypothetical protein